MGSGEKVGPDFIPTIHPPLAYGPFSLNGRGQDAMRFDLLSRLHHDPGPPRAKFLDPRLLRRNVLRRHFVPIFPCERLCSRSAGFMAHRDKPRGDV